MNEIITLEEVDFSYPELPALTHVNLSLSQGEFIGIIGPNGGGKTTFLKLILGLEKPQKGKVKVLGKAPSYSLDKIGYVPQRHELDPSFPISTLEVVLLGALDDLSPFCRKRKKELITQAKKLLKKVGLEKKEKIPFGELSGGEAQRALIARALIRAPEILLLDEPTSCIDWHGEKKIFDLLLSLKGKMTILMVSHDLELIVNQVDRVLSIHHTVETCLPDTVCEHFAMGLYHEPYPAKKRGK